MPPAITTRISPEQFMRESSETPEARVETMSPDVKRRAVAAATVSREILLRALVHRLAPDRFPVSADHASFEVFASRLVSEMGSDTFNRLRPTLERMADSEAERAAVLRTAPTFHLKRPIENAALASLLKLDISKLVPPTEKPIFKIPPKATPPKFNRAFLNLRRLQCLDETNPEGGADDMILGGVLIGPSGTATAVKSFVAGEFDDGTVWDYGVIPLGALKLDTTAEYPKNMYCVFHLVESDSDDQEVADAVSGVCTIAATFCTAIGQGLAAAAFAAAAGIIDTFASLFIDEDHFPPYGIQMRLDSENEFGPDGVDKNRRTGSIKGHGGTYRVGYRWELAA